MSDTIQSQTITIEGTSLHVLLAGDEKAPGLLLLHGLPNSSRMFRKVMPHLSRVCRIVAPDLPGFGASDPIPQPTFERMADLIEMLLDRLGIGRTFIYLHDFGAPVGLSLAMRRPERVLGLIIQNANAHRTGFGPAWAATQAFWSNPTAENAAAATTHLTLEGTRYQYVGDVPEDIAARMNPADWEEDWRVLSLPGRLDFQRELLFDYRRHVARFGEIAAYLDAHKPPALMLWGRHDPFFDLNETRSWIDDLPRLEVHILDGPHLLIETHGEICADLMARFLRRQLGQRAADHADGNAGLTRS